MIALKLPHALHNQYERGKPRPNLIQIELFEISLVWDLDDNEEISALIEPQQFTGDYFTQTGHVHFCETKNGPRVVQNNFDNTIFSNMDFEEENPNISKQYATIDLFNFMTIDVFFREGIHVKDVDHLTLLSNLDGRTFFSLFYQQHDVINLARDQFLNVDYQPEVREWSEIQQKVDHIAIRKLYQILKLPVVCGTGPQNVSSFAIRMGLTKKQNQAGLESQIILHALDNDHVLLDPLLELISISNEVRTNDVIATFKDFEKIFKFKRPSRNNFLLRARTITDSCQRITALLSNQKQECIYFASHSTQHSEKYIKKQFHDIVKQKKCENTQLTPYNVFILEIEWLSGNFQRFFINLIKSHDKAMFQNQLIKFLLNELDFTQQVILKFFVPYLIYMSLLLFYFCFSVTDPSDAQGFFGGSPGWITVRVLIVLFTAYFFLCKITQVSLMQKEFWSVLNLIEFFQTIEMLILNIYVIIADSRVNAKVDQLTVVQIASVATIQLWVVLFLWLRIFPSTAVYIQLIGETVSDLRNFILLFLFCICMFGSSVMILDKYQNVAIESYQTIIQPSFGNYITDSFITEYLLGFAQFNTGNFNENPSKVLCWIYFILATFFTQLLFFNMLIANMGATHDRVTNDSERAILMMKTSILSSFIYLLSMNNAFGDKRYLYIAMIKDQEEDQDQSDVTKNTSLIKENVQQISEDLLEYYNQMKNDNKIAQEQQLQLRRQFESQKQSHEVAVQQIKEMQTLAQENRHNIEQINRSLTNMRLVNGTLQKRFETRLSSLDEKLDLVLAAFKSKK